MCANESHFAVAPIPDPGGFGGDDGTSAREGERACGGWRGDFTPYRLWLWPHGITIVLDGGEALSLNIAGKLKTYRGRAEVLTLSTGGEDGATEKHLTVRGLAMAAAERGDEIGLDQLTATGSSSRRTQLPAEPDGNYSFNVSATGLRLPGILNLPLGDTISHIAADATMRGSATPSANLYDALARWRDSGGSVRFSTLRIDYGPLSVDGEGTLAVDGEAQPVGAFTVRMRGVQQTVAELSARGIIEDQTANKVRIALAFLARPARQDVPATVKVPLTLRDRILSVGPVPLFSVPEIEWPRGPVTRAG